MMSALWTGISGLKAYQTAIDNESNNVTNANTIGYKASRVNFADLIYQNNVGKGVGVTDAEKMFTQGTTKQTGNSYDLALNDDGFFTVSKQNPNGTSETYYTRAGNLKMSSDGTLVDSTNGYAVQGWAMNAIDATSDVTSTNSNWTYFNDNFTEIAGNQIVERNNSIETYAAKITDYESTSKTDDDVLTGVYGKTASSKNSDIQQLIKQYKAALKAYAQDTEAASKAATAQISGLDFKGASSQLDADGESLNVVIDGTTYSVEYQSVTATSDMITDIIASYGAGNVPLLVSNPGSTGTGTQADYDAIASRAATYKAMADKISNITGLNAYTATTNTNAGVATTDYQEVLQGYIKIESLDPGNDFVVGDVYETYSNTSSTTGTSKLVGDGTTFITAVEGAGKGAIDSAREALSNAITGKQYDVYSDDILEDNDGTPIAFASSADTFTYTIEVNGNTYSTAATTGTSYSNALENLVTAINSTAGMQDAVTASIINGQLVIEADEYGTDFTGTMVRTDTVNATTYNKERNADYSGNTGADAEFMEIVSTVDQTSTQSDIQLDLQALGLTDSAKSEFSVDENGVITMTQDGVDFVVGQISIAQFLNNSGLEAIGGNLYEATTESGDPIYETDNDNGTTITSEYLEVSNVELSDSLVNLMIFQRAFEASSKTVTTADDILNTLIDMKR